MDVILAIGVAGVAGALLALAVGTVVYLVAPSRWQNQLVALLLFFAAVEVGTTFGLADVHGWSPQAERGFDALNHLTWLVEPWLYLALLGTLDSPLSAPMRSLCRQRTLVGIGFAMIPAWFIFGGSVIDDSRILGAALGFHALVMLFGVVVAVSAWRRAAMGSADRARAKAFAFAFGVRDLATGAIGTFSAITTASTGTNLTPLPLFLLIPLSVVFMALFMGYGIARVSLFDIDLKVKRSVSRGTVAGVFLVVFLVVSQLIERVASENFGYVSGAVAAGILLFAINPLQRTADKLADKAMPKTEATPAYLTFRKMEVYKAAVEELAVGGVTAKERRALEALRSKLGLAASDAKDMERDIIAMRGVA